MTILYIDPLKRGWDRMVSTLFRPFNLSLWLGMGFAAWMAGFVDIGAGQWNSEGLDWTRNTTGDLVEGLIALTVVAGIAAVGIVTGIILLWVGSRAKFVFIDNVVQGHGAVVEPWTRHGRQGDSLFLWRLAFYAVYALLLVAVALPFIFFANLGSGDGITQVLAGATLMLMMGALCILILPFFFVNLILNDFVVPVMYRHGVSATEAWGQFMPVLREHLIQFILYALMVFVLQIGMGLALAAVAILTCCVGGVILSIPFVGTVLLLPVYVTYRAFSLEFLAQFGDTWRVLPTVSPTEPPELPVPPA